MRLRLATILALTLLALPAWAQPALAPPAGVGPGGDCALFCSLPVDQTQASAIAPRFQTRKNQVAAPPVKAPADPLAGNTRLEQLDDLAIQIQGQLEDLRGRRFKESVRVEEIDPAELASRVQARFESIFTPREIGVLEILAKLLGMLEGSEDLRTWFDSIPEADPKGFYDVTDDVFYVASGLEPETARFVMASELARAIEDQHHRIDERGDSYEGNADAWLAHQAVVQGALSTLMRLWLDRHVPEFGLVDMARLYERQSDALGSAPPFVWRPVLATRMRGESFLRRTHMVELNPVDARMADIDRAFREPPRSTEQILHPAKYWRNKRLDEPRLFRLAPLDLPARWSLAEENTLGELYLGILTLGGEERRDFDESTIVDLLSERYTTDASDGWGGDRYALLQREDGGYLVKLVTAWDSVSDAREFYQAMQSLRTVIEGAKRQWFDLGPGLSDFVVEYNGPDRVEVSSWVGVDRRMAHRILEGLVFEEVDSE